MPELPEVETIRRQLESKIVGKTVTSGRFFAGARTFPRGKKFLRRLMGKRIEGIHRRGKYLIFEFSDGDRLIAHLMMSGWFRCDAAFSSNVPYLRCLLELDSDCVLAHFDIRRLGALWLQKKGEAFPRIDQLGIDPFDPTFTAEYLFRLFTRHRIAIKILLMQQRIIAGIGNIYASEILFAARINPRKISNTMTRKESRAVIAATKLILAKAVRLSGTTFSRYQDVEGKRGAFGATVKAYGREGGRCLRCSAIICRIVQGGRSTFFCPTCQACSRRSK